MQFKVPQFLEIEDKIFGPFTFKQFVYLAGGAGLCFVLYKLLGIWVGGVPIIIVAAFCLALTFYRPNDKPFIFMLESVFKYVFQSKLYIWKRKLARPSKTREEAAAPEIYPAQNGGKLTGSKLRDLAWSLDVLDLSKQKENK